MVKSGSREYISAHSRGTVSLTYIHQVDNSFVNHSPVTPKFPVLVVSRCRCEGRPTRRRTKVKLVNDKLKLLT